MSKLTHYLYYYSIFVHGENSVSRIYHSKILIAYLIGQPKTKSQYSTEGVQTLSGTCFDDTVIEEQPRILLYNTPALSQSLDSKNLQRNQGVIKKYNHQDTLKPPLICEDVVQRRKSK